MFFSLRMRHLEPIVWWPLGVSCLEVKQHTLTLHCKNVFKCLSGQCLGLLCFCGNAHLNFLLDFFFL